MFTTRPLPKSRHTMFLQLLADHGLSEHQATAAIKMQWLLAQLDENRRMIWTTFADFARSLAPIAPDDEHELAKQDEIVHAFVRELRHSRVFLSKTNHRAMPKDVFKLLVSSIRGGIKERRITRDRLRAKLKLCWSSGISVEELLVMRRTWIKWQPDGYLLTISGQAPWVNRTIAIPRLKDSSVCAVRELDNWFETLPPSRNGFLFPRTDGHGEFPVDGPPFDRDEVYSAMNYRLRQIGHREYDYTSIRVSFLKRCREQLGEAAAFHLSGSKEFKSFRELLRAEADFIALPVDFDD
jgi:hypothetical protein